MVSYFSSILSQSFLRNRTYFNFLNLKKKIVTFLLHCICILVLFSLLFGHLLPCRIWRFFLFFIFLFLLFVPFVHVQSCPIWRFYFIFIVSFYVCNLTYLMIYFIFIVSSYVCNLLLFDDSFLFIFIVPSCVYNLLLFDDSVLIYFYCVILCVQSSPIR